MFTKISTEALLAGMPVAVVVFTPDGEIIAAGDLFWQMCGLSSPITCLSKLGSLGVMLGHIAGSDSIAEGHCVFRSSNGPLCITWRQTQTSDGPLVIACLTKENANGPIVNVASPGAPISNCRELPSPEATVELLERAWNTCRADRLPLCVVRIGVHTADGFNLQQVDKDAWRNIGRKLRATCRLSDLLGVTANGDFLVILLNTKLADALAATKRVISQLESWMAANVSSPVRIVTGFAPWTPGNELTALELLQQANIDQDISAA